MAEVIRMKIGLSAADKATMKSTIKQEIIDEFGYGTSENPIVPIYDSTCWGVRFWNNGTTAEGIGLLENATFMDMEGNQGNVLSKIGLSLNQIVERVEKPCMKNGVALLYPNGDPMVEYVARFKKFAVKVILGTDRYGRKYNDIVFRANRDLLNGFEYPAAFRAEDNSIKNYFDFSIYPLSAQVDNQGNTYYISVPGAIPTMEVNPNTVIHGHKPDGNKGLAFEWNYIELLSTVLFGTTELGRETYGYNPRQGFGANEKDNVGTKVAAWGGNTSSASNSLWLPNERAALIEIGEKIPLFTNNTYDATPCDTLVITAKTVGETYTECTFSGSATVCLNKYIHYNYHGQTGKTDTILTMNGYRHDFPIGYQPHKIFYIENLYGAYGNWCDDIYVNGNDIYIWNSLKVAAGKYTQQTPDSYLPTGWGGVSGYVGRLGHVANVMLDNSEHKYPVWHNIETCPSSQGFKGQSYFHAGNDTRALTYGHWTQATQLGSIHDVSCSSSNSWTLVAGNYLNFGCWGRVYRSIA